MAGQMNAAAGERGDTRVLWPLLALFWVGNIAATMAQVYLRQSLDGDAPSVVRLLSLVLPGYIVWLVGAPLVVVFLSRRFAFERGRWPASAAVHLAASIIIALANLAMDTIFTLQRAPQLEFGAVYVAMARGWLLWIVFTYWFFLAVLLAVRHSVTAGARQLRATQLEAAVAQAQLAALKTQLHPHFLFNALNSVSSLVAEEPRAAQKMIARLGELLRTTLADGGGGDWSLRRELELLHGYTSIEEVRFGERLRVEVACEPQTLGACVPALLLLPLVENAILHGIQPMMGGGTVRVAARREDGWLEIEVSDDGAGLPGRDGDRLAERVGLSNTRQRLEKRFGEEHTFAISPRSPSGTRVHITIPWTTAPAAEESHVPAA
jgi:signal transduction histidine kinase